MFALSRRAALALPLLAAGAAWAVTEDADNTVIMTLKNGKVVIRLRPDWAPKHVEQIKALVKRGFYDGLSFHRVVPDFVAQGGDPFGDGEGGPGWALPDEHTALHFDRGTLGIATSGPETGGSQFFFCHSAQPHLDGRYTVAGQLEGGDTTEIESGQH